MLLSIVIPFYNPMPHFIGLTESLMPQVITNDTFKSNIEVIFVNDGSTDNSFDIARQYESFKNVRIINIANGGVANARNIGLGYCSGRYVWFVDADDYIVPNAINEIIKAVNYYDFTPDIITANFYAFTEEDMRKKVFYRSGYRFDEYLHMSGIISDPFDSLFRKIQLHCAIFNHVFRVQYLRDNSITFDSSLPVSEDFIFKLSAIANAKRFGFIKSYIYGYRVDENRESLSRRQFSVSELLPVLDAEEKWFYYFERFYPFESGSEFMKMLLAEIICKLVKYMESLDDYHDNVFSTDKAASLNHIKSHIKKGVSALFHQGI